MKPLWKELAIPALIGAASMAVLVFAIVYVADRLVTETVENGGLRPAIEQLWCGEVGCMREDEQ